MDSGNIPGLGGFLTGAFVWTKDFDTFTASAIARTKCPLAFRSNTVRKRSGSVTAVGTILFRQGPQPQAQIGGLAENNLEKVKVKLIEG
jgi:hypothetical protein